MSWSRGVCEANGIAIHYLRTGGAQPPAVLLHGLMGSGGTWTPVARVLERELDVVMPDARGHGGSSAPRDGYRYDDLADDVVGLVRGLGLARPVLVGHSMGGMTAAVVASRGALRLRGLVLVDPTFLSPERQREVHESDVAAQHRRALGLSKAELLAEAEARGPGRSAELRALQAEARIHTRIEALAVLTPPNPPYLEVVRAIEVPTLLITGDRPVVTPDVARALCALNPRVQHAQVPDAGHGLPFDQPQRLAQSLLAFVRALPGGRPV